MMTLRPTLVLLAALALAACKKDKDPTPKPPVVPNPEYAVTATFSHNLPDSIWTTVGLEIRTAAGYLTRDYGYPGQTQNTWHIGSLHTGDKVRMWIEVQDTAYAVGTHLADTVALRVRITRDDQPTVIAATAALTSADDLRYVANGHPKQCELTLP